MDKKKRKYNLKVRSIIQKCANQARKNANPFVSFENLNVPFQDFHCLDLRDRGYVVLGLDHDGHPGVALDRKYRDFSPAEISEFLQRDYDLGYG